MQIAVLCGGLGTRLGALTERLPKALVPVQGRPFIDYQLDLFRECGLVEVVLCIGHLGGQIVAHVGGGGRYGLRVRYSADGEQQLGTAGAVRHAAPLLGEVFFLTYGDAYLPLDYRAIWEDFQQRAALAGMVVYRNEHRLERSNVVLDNGRVVAYDKDRVLPGMDYINFGVSVLRKEALRLIPEDGPYTQEAWYRDLIAAGQLVAYETAQRFYEVGSPRGLREFGEYLDAAAGRGVSA